MPYKIKKSKILTAGCFLMSLGYFLFGPAPFLFDPNLSVVAISLVILGCGQTLMNGKSYIVPTMPHMIEVAQSYYALPEDDRLNDSISTIANIFMSLGEITGPVAGSFMSIYFGFRNALTVYAFVLLLYAIFYAFSSDAFKATLPQTKEKVLETALIEF